MSYQECGASNEVVTLESYERYRAILTPEEYIALFGTPDRTARNWMDIATYICRDILARCVKTAGRRN
ncbi:hypothetical protein J2S03_003492 [Alicyclobacillus cycloheptanicus]|uniref:DNA (cytosine-5-)-methyltransferase n=1 Tax=Alicyclobacillus cycloheptanicus TaxID=1457 RepID=A0ABT9XMR8_9BACL|nr:hypothetical protein [Alicyclobacillus cycloheptanicus]